jgi:hypothetical protein
VAVGETETVEPVKLPGFQVYTLPPVADKLVVSPAQIWLSDAEAFRTIKGVEITWTVVVAVQPLASVPVTVSVVFTDGMPLNVAPVILPGCQT